VNTNQMDVQTVVEQYQNAVRELNATGTNAVPSDAEASRLKSAIAAGYDLALQSAQQTGLADQFWNWGLHDPQFAAEIEKIIPGFNRYGTDGYGEELYYSALRRLPVDIHDYAGRSVLEVGCGMGEGLNFLSRITSARQLVGLDRSALAIERARAKLSRDPQLRYTEGDAENLPFDDGEFDVIINIESSHNYPNLGRFFDEVARVLKPGGHFSYLDIFTPTVEARFNSVRDLPRPLQWTGSLDISDSVKLAITQRMQPDSYFSEAGRHGGVPFLPRIVSGYMRSMLYGGHFIGLQPTRALRAMSALHVVSIPPARDWPAVGSYSNYWARKPD
jgi:ubiquinone/menaquinone biosynthesis C-methylase UbiE